MPLLFFSAMGLLIVVLKIASALRQRPPRGFWLSLLPSPRSLRRATPVTAADTRRALVRLALATLGFAGWWIAYRIIVQATGAQGFWLAWLAAPQVWLMGELCGTLHRVVLLPTGRLLPLPHAHPLAARSVADFWGRRWNIWMSDWFRDMIFQPLRCRPRRAMLAVFLLSGIIHELVINLPLWLVTGRNLFGTMLAYFGVQAVGLFIERTWLAAHPQLQRAFTWLVVLGPAPLFVNEGILRALWLWK